MLLPTLLFHACTGAGSAETPEEGVSWQLAQERKARITDIRYELDIRIPRSRQERLSGSNTVSFQLKNTDHPLILDFKVPADHLKEVKKGTTVIPYRFENGHVVINANLLQTGANSISLFFDLGDQSLNRQEDFLYTLLVPDRASTAIPCFDQPNLKARYKLSLTIPQDWEALANGPLESEQTQDSLKVLHYTETRPLPTYLFDFVAGKFQKVNSEAGGRSMTMLHRETDTAAVQRNLAAIFDLHLSAINWLENYTGIKMPFQKFDFALIPAFQYGGMEHPGAITYKASSLFLDENATENQELGRASLIAHETAHMWFGDLVTMNWFDDVWMKEVFANFMAAKIVNPSFPDINHDLRFVLAHYPGAYEVDRSAGTHPIQQPLANLKDAGTLYGSIIYQKAPIVMRMLEREIGEEAMRRGLQEYLSTYSYDNATWDDLIEILDRQSPENLDAWNQQWIKQAGMPEIELSRSVAMAQSTAAVELELLNGADGKRWSQKLGITAIQDKVRDSILLDFDNDHAHVAFSDALSRPALIIANADGYGYGYFVLDEVSRKYLLKNINQLESPMWRGVSWLSLWENMLHLGIHPKFLVPVLLEGIQTETDPLIRQRILGYLGNLYWQYLSEPARKQVNGAIEQVLWNALEKTGDRRWKTALFGTYRNVAESPAALERLQAIWDKKLEVTGLSLSENDYIELAFQLAVRATPDSETLLEQQLARVTNADRKAQMSFIKPALSADESVRDSFFNSLKKEENRQVESWVQEALGWLHHPLRAASAEKYIRPTLDMLEEIQATGDIFFPKRVLDNTFGGHRSEAAVGIVNQFLKEHPNYPDNLRNKILQAADGTFRAAGILPAI